MAEKVRLIGFDELARSLERADELFLPVAATAMAISLTAIEGEIAPYPPQPDRMRSGHFNGYVRGIGRFPKSAFMPDVKEPGGFKQTKTAKQAKVKFTSEQMDKRFKQTVKVSEEKITGELRNDASYSGVVIGPKEGDPHQASFHAETGWVSADEAIQKATPKIEEALDSAIDLFITRLKGD